MDDLHSLAHDLSSSRAKLQREAVAIVEHGAVNVKQKWADNARASSGVHAPDYPNSVTYDFDVRSLLAGDIRAEIGPDKNRRQGALGNLLEFGSANNAPHNDGGRALRDEAPRFEEEIGRAGVTALGF